MFGREVKVGADADLCASSGEAIAAGDLVLELGASGWTYHDVFVLHDRQTGSLWYPYPQDVGLRSIAGPLEGHILKSRPGHLSAWREWSAAHPDTLLLGSE